jgi:hypothetical protein
LRQITFTSKLEEDLAPRDQVIAQVLDGACDKDKHRRNLQSEESWAYPFLLLPLSVVSSKWAVGKPFLDGLHCTILRRAQEIDLFARKTLELAVVARLVGGQVWLALHRCLVAYVDDVLDLASFVKPRIDSAGRLCHPCCKDVVSSCFLKAQKRAIDLLNGVEEPAKSQILADEVPVEQPIDYVGDIQVGLGGRFCELGGLPQVGCDLQQAQTSAYGFLF